MMAMPTCPSASQKWRQRSKAASRAKSRLVVHDAAPLCYEEGNIHSVIGGQHFCVISSEKYAQPRPLPHSKQETNNAPDQAASMAGQHY